MGKRWWIYLVIGAGVLVLLSLIFPAAQAEPAPATSSGGLTTSARSTLAYLGDFT